MSEVDFLDLEDLLVAVDRLGAIVRDYGLLDASVHRPQTTVFGTDAYPSIWSKAAALMQSLDHGQALIDGNKRLSWIATELFLKRNGRRLTACTDDAYSLCMAVASGLDLEKIAETLRGFCHETNQHGTN